MLKSLVNCLMPDIKTTVDLTLNMKPWLEIWPSFFKDEI
jgi:hypothetical protein